MCFDAEGETGFSIRLLFPVEFGSITGSGHLGRQTSLVKFPFSCGLFFLDFAFDLFLRASAPLNHINLIYLLSNTTSPEALGD